LIGTTKTVKEKSLIDQITLVQVRKKKMHQPHISEYMVYAVAFKWKKTMGFFIHRVVRET
jgi:hypothetical protein